MEKVNSFIVDHTKLQPGIYLSEVNGCFTYDIRFVAPVDAHENHAFMQPEVAHTIEHFMASYLRNKTSESFSSSVIYVGPMGCLTGFYLVTKVRWCIRDLQSVLRKCFEHILDSEDIPGASPISCGNYEFFDLPATKRFIKRVVIPLLESDKIPEIYPIL